MAITTVLTNDYAAAFILCKLRAETASGRPINKANYVLNGLQYTAYKNPVSAGAATTQYFLEIQPFPFLGTGRTSVSIGTSFNIEIG